MFSEIVCLHFGSAVETSELDTYVEPTQLADEPSARDSESCKERVVVFFFAELMQLAARRRADPRAHWPVRSRLAMRCATASRAATVLSSAELKIVEAESMELGENRKQSLSS